VVNTTVPIIIVQRQSPLSGVQALWQYIRDLSLAVCLHSPGFDAKNVIP
jgi:hypothetical protein